VSYGISLKIERGFILLANVYGDLPEGQFDITGHQAETQEDLGVNRRNADGTFAGAAHHSHAITPPAGAEASVREADPF
jgi:hypothetical protein